MSFFGLLLMDLVITFFTYVYFTRVFSFLHNSPTHIFSLHDRELTALCYIIPSLTAITRHGFSKNSRDDLSARQVCFEDH